MMNEQQLVAEIVKHCKKNNIFGSINNSFKDYLVSFDIKLKKTHCKECGKKFSKPSQKTGEKGK